jgi:NitT/TauT family transport system substrate-binding protein
MRFRIGRMLVCGVLTAALGVLVAACGSSSTKVKTVSASAIPSKPEPGVIKMGIEPWIGYGPWYIAEQEGYFKQLGLNVKIINFNTDAQREAAFASGNTDVTNMPTHTALRFEQQNIAGRMVLLEDESLTADAVIAQSPFNSIKSLKGHKVAYEQGTTSDILIHYALAANGMKPSDVQIVPINASDAGSAAAAGRVSAAVTYEPYISAVIAQHKGFKRIYVAGVDPGLVSDVLVASTSLLNNKPGQVLGLMKAWGMAMDFYNSHPAQAQAIIAKADGASLASLKTSFSGVKLYTIPQNASLLDGTFANKIAIDVMHAAIGAGVLSHPLTPSAYIEPQFVTAAAKG